MKRSINLNKNGIAEESWESLRRTKVFLKAPITTPQGGGFKSLNVTVRKSLGLFANVRPCVSYHPFVRTNHPKMDLVIIRENEEDLYGGIEYRQSRDVMASLKVISVPVQSALCATLLNMPAPIIAKSYLHVQRQYHEDLGRSVSSGL